MISFSKQIVLVIIGIAIAYFYPHIRAQLSTIYGTNKAVNVKPVIDNGARVITQDELSQYNGVDKPQLYLALLGNVYDVTKGEKHYGKDGSYQYFVGE